MQLDHKVAVVTGAGRGMGRSIALGLAGEGANIVAADIDAAAAEDTSIEVRDLGRDCLALHTDVGDVSQIDRMISDAKDRFGRIDIIVNNAGVTRYLYVMDVQEADWDRIHRVNAKGVFFCMQRAAREMIEQGDGGRIINIASIAGKGYSGTSNAAYAASKGAVISMTMIAAHQLGSTQHQRQRYMPGVDNYGDVQGDHGRQSRERWSQHRRARAGARRAHSNRAFERAGGHRRDGGVPSKSRRSEHYRPGVQRGRRAGDALNIEGIRFTHEGAQKGKKPIESTGLIHV